MRTLSCIRKSPLKAGVSGRNGLLGRDKNLPGPVCKPLLIGDTIVLCVRPNETNFSPKGKDTNGGAKTPFKPVQQIQWEFLNVYSWFRETVRIYGEIRGGIYSRTNSNYLSRYGDWSVHVFEYFATMETRIDSSFITFLSEIYYCNVELQRLMNISCRYLT